MQRLNARITPDGKHIARTNGALTPKSTNSRQAAQTTMTMLRHVATQRSGVIGGNSN